MGLAKELMMELQQARAVSKAVGIQPADLEGYGYQIREDEFRTLVVWDDEVPPGVRASNENGEQVSEVSFDHEPDGPDDD